MTLTKGNLILTISQAWLLLLLEKSKMYTQSCAQEHANIIMVSFILLKYINFCSRQFGIILMMKFVSLSFYGLANMMISGSVIINYQKKNEESMHIKSIVLLFSIGLLFFLLQCLRLRFFFFISKQIYLYDCKEFQSLRKCIAFCYPFSEETAHIM